jgi:pimeloyl-ACP methyl ester carboxylesterase
LRARETPRQTDPLFILAGGPGQAPSSLINFVATTFADVRRHRDIVLVDLLGTGRSHSLACPELAQPSTGGLFDPDWLPPEAVSRCRSRLESNADLRLYTTEIAMADLDEVRAALGYEQVNLYGTSYGTRAAQIYMRDFPERVRTVTLKAVVPQSMTLPATHAIDAEQAWQNLVERCDADLRCRAAYPTLDADFQSVLTRLERSPVIIDASADGGTTRLTLTRGLFGESFRHLLYSPALAARAPAIVRALSRGDYSSIAQFAQQTRTLAGGDDISFS